MNFISLWAGRIEPPGTLPGHLEILYGSLGGTAAFQRDPQVCAEREQVPIDELLEPFSLSEPFLTEAIAAADRQSLRLANTVVAVYTRLALKAEAIETTSCELRFIGTFPDAQPADAA